MFHFLRSPVFAICLVIFGAFLFYSGRKNAIEYAALLDHGKTAEAKITNLEWKEKQSNHEDSRYIATVRFETEDGREINTDLSLDTNAGRELRSTPQASITIRYLPESPNTIRDINKEDSSDAQKGVGRIMMIVGVVLLGIRFFLAKKQA